MCPPVLTKKTKKSRLSPNITKKLATNYVFHSRIEGYNTSAEALKAGIRDCLDDSIKPERYINEDDYEKKNLTEVAVLEKINKGEIIKWKDSTEDSKNDIPIEWDEKHIKEFDIWWDNHGFRNRSEACRAVMYCQIIEWKKKYDAEVKKFQIKEPDSAYVINGNNLNEFLDWLKQRFCQGPELVLEWHPDKDKSDDGEVIEGKIYIYSKTFEEAEYTLAHEYLHQVFHVLFTKPFWDYIKSNLTYNTSKQNNQLKELIENFEKRDYKIREKFIDELAKSLVSDWHSYKQVTSLLESSGTGEHSQTASQT